MRSVIAIGVLGILVSCSGPTKRDVRVTILDEAGHPVVGAAFYAEAYDEAGAFDFLTARAGDAGEVPDSAREPLKIAWRPGARIALAAFAPGFRPTVVRNPDERVESDGALLVLEEDPSEPVAAVASLAFPFENEPTLAARVSHADHEELLAHFLSALEAIQLSGQELKPAEIRKIKAINDLK